MVRLRLRRVGRKKQASFRLVAADARSPRDGRFIEVLGHYNPRTDPPTILFKEDRVMEWLHKGAQPTDSVKQLLVTSGLWKRYTGQEPPARGHGAPPAPAPESPAPIEQPVAAAGAES
ncbi:MAG TPA: 30S ribosomal protein S16 [Candidatus Nitrosotenuis sp.]|jgi:small subunit ribosomal protein S16|nr:30S ribosomal protein S16 [Candidatus Nitrosotenuis sp.]